MAETTTGNAQLAKLAVLAHEFLLPYVGLPTVSQLGQALHPVIDWMADIELQLRSQGDFHHRAIENVAVWARELGTSVRFRDGGSYVEISAWTTTRGQSVKVWDHVRYREADRVLTRLAVELVDRGSVDIDPNRLLEQASTEDGA